MSTVSIEAQIEIYGKEAAEKLIQVEDRRKEIIVEFAEKVAALPGIVREKVARIIIRCLRQLNCRISATYVYQALKEKGYVSEVQSNASSKNNKERYEDGYDPGTHK